MSSTHPAAVNYWPDSACARAFWSQHELPPYQKLLADTVAWMDPRPGERWLDLGCGCGQLAGALWEKSGGTLAEVVAVDCAAANEKPLRKLAQTVQPPAGDRIRFLQCDFSHGLGAWRDGQFDGAVSGLAIQYAESFSVADNCWTSDAYEHLLAEIRRVLRPGGRFVFSVNVPDPAWGKVALNGLSALFRTRQPGRFLKNAYRMMRYGSWLKREARRGRFHYLPASTIANKLTAAGFVGIEHRLSYADQAFVVRCRRPG
jgi:ubiquinone/menaquinone biosynthesis C-methylase UbiE